MIFILKIKSRKDPKQLHKTLLLLLESMGVEFVLKKAEEVTAYQEVPNVGTTKTAD